MQCMYKTLHCIALNDCELRRLESKWIGRIHSKGPDFQRALDIHGAQFCHQEPEDVGHSNPLDEFASLAHTAVYRALVGIRRPLDSDRFTRRQRCRHGREREPALGADIADGVVTAAVQSVVQQVCGAMGQQRIALHFSKADASTKFAALDGLLRDVVDGAG